jgi:hypothetical protein
MSRESRTRRRLTYSTSASVQQAAMPRPASRRREPPHPPLPHAESFLILPKRLLLGLDLDSHAPSLLPVHTISAHPPPFSSRPKRTSQPVPKSVVGEIPAILAKAVAESPLRRYSATASTRASAKLRTRRRASHFKMVSWLSITRDSPDSPRALFQPRSHGRYSDVFDGRTPTAVTY